MKKALQASSIVALMILLPAIAQADHYYDARRDVQREYRDLQDARRDLQREIWQRDRRGIRHAIRDVREEERDLQRARNRLRNQSWYYGNHNRNRGWSSGWNSSWYSRNRRGHCGVDYGRNRGRGWRW